MVWLKKKEEAIQARNLFVSQKSSAQALNLYNAAIQAQKEEIACCEGVQRILDDMTLEIDIKYPVFSNVKRQKTK